MMTTLSIWFDEKDATPGNMQLRAKNSMSDFLGIHFTDIGPRFLVATMPVNEKTKQPMGIMHGGASCVLAETVGSTAANYCVDHNKQFCVGLDINTSHIKSIREGLVIATAEPVHIGRSTHVWRIDIHDEGSALISTTRLTMAVLDRR